MKTKILSLVLLLAFLAACTQPTPPPTRAPTLTPTATVTVTPTPTPEPTEEIEPLVTPEPGMHAGASEAPASGGEVPAVVLPPILGLDTFSLNGIPADVDAMHKKFDFGWYQLTNGMSVTIPARSAWPVYAKYYGGYAFFQPVPQDANWFYQSWDVYAEESARLFVTTMAGNYGGTPPLVDVEQRISEATLDRLFPNDVEAVQVSKGKTLYLRELKIFCDTVEALTNQKPILYTGKSFWEDVVGGANATWAARLPLVVANYPYDNYTSQFAYESAIQGVMAGTVKLPTIPIPRPWTKAWAIQFTGRAPVYLIPGYASGGNWAQTIDLNILVQEIVPPPIVYPAYKVQPGTNPNVRAVNSPSGTIIGVMLSGTVIYVDTIDANTGYAHFIPTDTFKGGGWVWNAFLIKQ